MSGSGDPPSRGDPAAAAAAALEFRGPAAGAVAGGSLPAPRAVVAGGPAMDARLGRGLDTVVGLPGDGRLSPRRVGAVAGAGRMDFRPHMLRAGVVPMYGGAAVAHGASRPGSPSVPGFSPGCANPTIQPVIRAPTAPPPVFHQAPFGFAGSVQPFFGGGAAFFPGGFQFGSPQGVRAGGFLSLLNGVCPNVSPHCAAFPTVEREMQRNSGETNSQIEEQLSPPSADDEVTFDSEEEEVYSDEEEEVYGDDEADDEGCSAESDGDVVDASESSDEEGVDIVEATSAAAVTQEVDEALQYEIIPTALGDCGCVSTRPGYKKRVRWPKGVHPPDCRQPRDMGAIEKAMRNSKNRTTTHIFEPVLGMVFDSRAEAYNFINLYSWEVGFGIRYDTSARNRVNKYRTMQEIVCEKEGFDPRCTGSSKRDHCKAMLRLHRSQDHGWYVSKHVAEHNHPLSISCGEKREWNSHSKIEPCTKDMIRFLRENNVSLSRVHCIMGNLYGSMQNVPFNQKSLRAICAQIARDHKDDDVAKTLEVFRKMRAEDPGFQFTVDLDEEKKIKTLLWTSGRSRSQYAFFGDAITFDTTYCTNLYKMPFGMFVGVNNHFQSTLFVGVLMRDETAESFKWVFKEFITLMGGKAPKTILTDQCKAMKKAIREVLKDTTHLWCKWHIFKDAPEELGTVYRRNGPFRREFHFVINQMLTEDEFERAWDDLMERYQLHGHPFMEKTHKKKKMWAKPWCKDIYSARMASTEV